jgi:hypothetical protein
MNDKYQAALHHLVWLLQLARRKIGTELLGGCSNIMWERIYSKNLLTAEKK